MKKQDIINKLKEVYDPELQIDVWTMGLIRKIGIIKDKVSILMTLTTPMCPYGGMLVEQVKAEIGKVAKKVEVELTFDPPWEPSEELRATLGI